MLGQPCHRPLEGGPVGGIDRFEQTAGKIKRPGREIVVDRASRRGEREEGFPPVGAVQYSLESNTKCND